MSELQKNSLIHSHFTQQAHLGHFLQVPINLLAFYPAGPWWTLSKRTLQFAHTLPSGWNASKLQTNSPIPSRHIWQVHRRHFLKEFITSPMRYILKELTGYFLKVPSHVIKMCLIIYPVGSLWFHGKTGLHWGFVVSTLERTQWAHCDYMTGYF